jgi:hypothetical protein
MPTFNTPYDGNDPRNGQTVTIIDERMVRNLRESAPLMKQYTVRFPDGFEDNVWPEEIGEEES